MTLAVSNKSAVTLARSRRIVKDDP
jgi:hypothetical protein